MKGATTLNGASSINIVGISREPSMANIASEANGMNVSTMAATAVVQSQPSSLLLEADLKDNRETTIDSSDSGVKVKLETEVKDKVNTETFIDKLKLTRYRSRIIRTVVACLVTAIIYKYFLGDRNPCFACIGAVYGMGSQFQEGFHNGFNRFVGTFIGGLVVIPSYWLYLNTPFGVPGEIYLCIGVFFVMYINFLLGANNAIQPGTVVYFVVLFTQPEANFVGYTIDRIIDTGVGVLFSLIITMLRPTMIDREKGVDFLTFVEAIKEGFHAWCYANKCGSLPQLDAEARAAKREERKARYIQRHTY